MSDQMNPMGPAEPEIMSQDAEDVIGLQHGQSDREGAMAKADLYKIANYSHKLFKQIEDEDQMEAWVRNYFGRPAPRKLPKFGQEHHD
jgi:hypothetical protein